MTTTKAAKRAISARTVIRRIDRKLVNGVRYGNPERLRTIRTGFVERCPVHEHVIVDLKANGIVAHGVDLAKLARELGVLEPWEAVDEGA
jgi:hypothetical protein